MDQEQDRDVRNKNQALKKSGKKLTVIEKSLVIRVILAIMTDCAILFNKARITDPRQQTGIEKIIRTSFIIG